MCNRSTWTSRVVRLLAVVWAMAPVAVAGEYAPGDVRAGRDLAESLDPPAQLEGGEDWQVTESVKLVHQAYGEGRNVLTVHGGPGYPFRGPILSDLHSDYRFHYYAQRGCGASTTPDWRTRVAKDDLSASLEKHMGIGAHVADIERIRRILGEEKLVIIGHSFGGFLAAMYAAEFPERVEKLVLIAPAGVLVFPEEGGLLQAIRERLHEDDRGPYDTFLKNYMDFSGVGSLSDQEARQLNANFGMYFMAAQGGGRYMPAPPGYVQFAPGFVTQGMYISLGKSHDWREAVGKIKAPTLILHGDKDLIPMSSSNQYAEAMPGAKLVTLAGADHMPFVSTPEAFTEAVRAFLAGP